MANVHYDALLRLKNSIYSLIQNTVILEIVFTTRGDIILFS